MKKEFKKTICALLALCMLLGFAACGEESGAAGPAYGNEPNNLYQNAAAPCFGEGRAYYISSDDEVMSVALDGSDLKRVGALGNVTRYSYSPEWLNWYGGSVYYAICYDREDYSARYFEIRSMDVASGAETVVLTCEDAECVTCTGMLIIGDDLFYACYDVENKSTTYNVLNLLTSARNQLMKIRGAYNRSPVFTVHGGYLYILDPVGNRALYRTALSGIYESKPEFVNVLGDTPLQTAFLAGDGLYAVKRDENQGADESEFVFYPFQEAPEGWSCEVVAENILDGDNVSTEEEIINTLVRFAYNWLVGGAFVSYTGVRLYYSPSVDFTNSTQVGELDLAYGETLHAGVYEGTLYLIAEGANGLIFHTLTADGIYQ